MENIINKTLNAEGVFNNYFLDTKNMFMYCFNAIPSVTIVSNIDGEKVFHEIKQRHASLIRSIHEFRRFERGEEPEFGCKIMVLNNECVLEFSASYCEVLYNYDSAWFAQVVIALSTPFKEKKKRSPREINLVVRNGNYLELKSMEITKTKLDIDLFFEDDFKETDAIIRQRLNQKRDKGVILLHGLPGTGKTTYLRHLAGVVNKRLLFLSPTIAGNLLEPEFVELLLDNPNSILVVEDAENLIMDRKTNSSSAVAGLLNISDGLLADFLNVQLICTFNNSLTMVDSALMRKGRLIAKYEFGRLSIAKAQRLSDHLGFKSVITKPMTVAEIANQHEKATTEIIEGIGFKVNRVLSY